MVRVAQGQGQGSSLGTQLTSGVGEGGVVGGRDDTNLYTVEITDLGLCCWVVSVSLLLFCVTFPMDGCSILQVRLRTH